MAGRRRIYTFTKPWSSAKKISGPADRPIFFPAVALGAAAIVTQFVFLREFLSVFYGNELILGTILALWMIITGLGSMIGKRIEHISLGVIFFSLGITPLISIFFLRFIRHLIFDPGVMVNFGTFLASSAILLFPFCFIAGFTFPRLSQLSSGRRGENTIPRVYSWEALGSVIGGIVFSSILINHLSSFQILSLMAITNFLIAFAFSIREKRLAIIFLSLLCFVTGALSLIYCDLEAITRQYLFPREKLLFFKDTPYGQVTVTDRQGQINFYENGILLFSSPDYVYLEESVHYAMVRHRQPRRILVISGGFTGLTEEIMKYKSVRQVDYIELNPALTELGKVFTPKLEDPRIHVINKDARIFIKDSHQTYDVVLINLPDPQTAQINRFYTDEFFQELKSSLDRHSIVSLSLSSSADYLSKEARAFKGNIISTLKKNFTHVKVIPASKDFLLASDSPIEEKIIPLLEQKGIVNTYVNRHYIDEDLIMRRSQQIMTSVDKEVRINSDFYPLAYWRSLALWFSAFEWKPWWLLSIVILIPLFILFKSFNTISYGIFTAGLSASSLEVMILLSFQAIYGYVYQMLSIIITVFMAGLSVGALYRPNFGKWINHFACVQYGVALLSFLFFLLLMTKSIIPRSDIYPHLFFVSITFLVALLIGAQFSLASFLSPGHIVNRAAQLYGVDLIGAAIGAMLTSTLLVPVLGLPRTGLVISLLNIASGTLALWNKRNYTIQGG
ncbi:MAG: fused MFS/spermidine synthase [Syntrophales bacterium]|nr:fused MFS/spermidine synthase [Syntrophales bacterium]